MIPVAEARARVLAPLATLPAEIVALPAAHGRILAADIAARLTQPPADVSAMDGYAARAADLGALPATLRLVGEAPAGGAFPGTVGAGECVRIFTGGPVPAGADTIVLQENVTREGAAVTVANAAPAGKHIRRAGLDFRAGARALTAGRLLSARDIGLAAAMNHPWLAVRRRPRVAIVANGDEVVLPGDPIGPNQIVSSNAAMLEALVASWGGVPLNLGIAPDRADALQEIAARAAGSDLLVTTGGASVGDYDLVRGALEAKGLAVDFWQIAMRPGKPLMSGTLGTLPMLGLPGNPVSTFVCAVLFLRPALRRMLGVEPASPPLQAARLAVDLGANDQREDYLRSALEPREGDLPLVRPFPVQDSSMVSVLARADCLLLRPVRAPPAAAGTVVQVVPLD